MKKYIFICFLLHNVAFGQYQSLFGDSTTTWSIMENRSNLDDPQYPIYNLSIDHDTIDVNGDTIYFIIGTSTNIGYGSVFPPNEYFYAKEDVTQGKAWVKKNYIDTTWYKIFDLSLNIGDVIGSSFSYNLPQGPVDSVYFDVQNRKHIRFNQNISYSGKYEFIEGVGSSFGLARTMIYNPGRKPTLVCQHKNGILNYGLKFQLDLTILPTTIIFFDNCEFTLNADELSESFFQLSPNPVNDVLKLTIPDGEVLQGVKIYNALGQEVFLQNTAALLINVAQLESGFYTIELAINDKRYAKRFVKV